MELKYRKKVSSLKSGTEEISYLLSIIDKQEKAIELLLYYIEGDSTWEALYDKVEKMLNEDE